MGFVNVIEYRHVFDEPCPEVGSLVANLPSKFVIGLLAIINDTLTIRGESTDTQEFLLYCMTVNITPAIRAKIFERVRPLIQSGRHQLFSIPYTVEFVNRELINFREEDANRKVDFAADELNFFKAYIAVTDDMVQREVKKNEEAIIAAATEGGVNLIKLMWPHLIKQFEFTNRPDPIYERFRGRALMSYLESHEKYKEYALSYFQSFGCTSGQEYLNRIESLIVRNLQREQSDDPMSYFFRIRVDQPEPVFEGMVIDPEQVRNNESKQIDYRGLKEKPLFQFEKNEYVVPHWDYLYNSLVTGLLFAFHRKSGVKKVARDFDGFKSTISREFSDEILFRNTMKKCFGRANETLLFFEDKEVFNPDCYYRRGRNVFVIEFKDYLLATDVIQSSSYDAIKKAIDDKFVGDNKGGDNKGKGINQLAWNIEYLIRNKEKFYEIDELAKSENLDINDLIFYPVIVQTNIYFDLPGLNDYLDEVYQQRIKDVKQEHKYFAPLTMINFQYFYEHILQYSDSQLQFEEEIIYYHHYTYALKRKAQTTGDENHWFYSLSPFSLLESEKSESLVMYRREDILRTINECWQIADTDEPEK
ncbi:MAG: hypothetical protein BGO69_12810 [Bacteroidetes bacterium 46-16]|nr:MAG: hypothetical protein BGO69_12810 [Bacteroidetes bacterium 46-16]